MVVLAPVSIRTESRLVIILANFGLKERVNNLFCSKFILSVCKATLASKFASLVHLKVLTYFSLVLFWILEKSILSLTDMILPWFIVTWVPGLRIAVFCFNRAVTHLRGLEIEGQFFIETFLLGFLTWPITDWVPRRRIDGWEVTLIERRLVLNNHFRLVVGTPL